MPSSPDAAGPAGGGGTGPPPPGLPPVGGLPVDPVVAPVPLADLPASLRDRLEPRVQRLGYLGAFFALLGHQPRALEAFYEYTEALKTALPDDLTELVALTAATRMGNDYERIQHERLARTHGQTEEWVDAVEVGTYDRLSERQALVRRLVDRMLDDSGHGVETELEAVVADLGDELAVAVLMLVGRYVAHAHIANALRLTVPPRVR